MPQPQPATAIQLANAEMLELLRRTALERFDFFCSAVLGYLVTPFHAAMMNHILHTPNSMVLAARGSGKSTIDTVAYILWRIVKNPNLRIAIASKTGDQAKSFLGEIKAHIDGNADFIRIFGELRGPLWNEKEITLATRTKILKEPTITAIGAGAGIPGRHFDLIDGDDLVDLENSATEYQREKMRVWFYSVLLPTLEPEGELRIVGTRYHPQDIYGHFAGADKKTGSYNDDKIGPYVHCVPAITKDEAGNEVSFWPSKFSLQHLHGMRRSMGLAIFNLQMQNDARITEGGIIHIEDIEPYVWAHEGQRPPLNQMRIFIGVDPAISIKDEADFFSLSVIGISDERHIYVLESLKEKISFKKQVEIILSKYHRYGAEAVGIETIAYQQALAQEILDAGQWINVVQIKPRNDKTQRAQVLSAFFERHEVHLHYSMIDLMETLVGMPGVDHDDDFDSLDHAITAAKETVLSGSVIAVMPSNFRRR